MVSRSLMARLLGGGGSHSSWSSELHTMPPSSGTWVLIHWTRTGGVIWSVPPNFRSVGFASCGQAQEIWGHPVYPTWSQRHSMFHSITPDAILWAVDSPWEDSVLSPLWLSAQVGQVDTDSFLRMNASVRPRSLFRLLHSAESRISGGCVCHFSQSEWKPSFIFTS